MRNEDEWRILRMVQDLYGKKWHKSSECFIDDVGDTMLFVKDRAGNAQFALNLSVLSQVRQCLDTDFIQEHLMRATWRGKD